MKKLLALSSLLVIIFGSQAMAASGSATAKVRIVTPIQISATGTDLQFGSIAAGATSGTVTISTAGVASVTGGATLVTGGTARAASTFTVNGEPNAAYTISAISGINLTGGTPTIATTFVALSTSSSSATAGTLTAGGSDTITVGGTITVAASQPAAEYSGSYTVTVQY